MTIMWSLQNSLFLAKTSCSIKLDGQPTMISSHFGGHSIFFQALL